MKDGNNKVAGIGSITGLNGMVKDLEKALEKAQEKSQ